MTQLRIPAVSMRGARRPGRGRGPPRPHLLHGPLHHAMTGTGAVALAAAAAIPGTVVHRVCEGATDGRVRFGHPSGTLTVGAEARQEGGGWVITKVMMSRTARRLMEGWVRVPSV